MYKDFHDLAIWQESFNLLMKLLNTVEQFPHDEKYALCSQLRRSANSIVANIAESHGRYHFKDKVRILYIARGEILETRSHLAVAYGSKYINKKSFKDYNTSYKNLTKQLNLYINHLSSK